MPIDLFGKQSAQTNSRQPIDLFANENKSSPDNAPQEESPLSKMVGGATDTLKNLGAGMATGGQNISNTLGDLADRNPNWRAFKQAVQQKTGITIPRNINMENIFGVNDTNRQPIVETSGQYSPLLALGPVASPKVGYLGTAAAEGGAGGAYGLTQDPENPLHGGLLGAGFNAGGGLLGKSVGAKNYLLGLLGRAGLGAATGYGLNGVTGAEYGAGAGILLPQLGSTLGLTKTAGKNIAQMVSPEEVQAANEAAARQGIDLSPSEASGRPDVARQEAAIGRVGEGATQRIATGKERIAQQQQAIGRFKDEVSPEGQDAAFNVRKAAKQHIEDLRQARQDAVQPLYEEAYKERVDPNLLSDLEKSDPNISNAIDTVMNDPKYQTEGELLNEPRNSIKVLDYAKRELDKQIEANTGTIASPGDRNAVRVLTKSKNKLLNSTDNFSDNYKAARAKFTEMSPAVTDAEQGQIGRIAELKDTQLKNVSKMIFDPGQTDLTVLRNIKNSVMKNNPDAWDAIVRNHIDNLTKKGDMIGSTFYKNVLENQNHVDQLNLALDHNPKAQETLNDLRTVFKDITNPGTVRGEFESAKRGMTKLRETVGDMLDRFHEAIGSKQHAEAVRYLYSPRWQADVRNIQATGNQTSKKTQAALLLAKTIPPAYLYPDQRNQ